MVYNKKKGDHDWKFHKEDPDQISTMVISHMGISLKYPTPHSINRTSSY
jgi:hypothetical protein